MPGLNEVIFIKLGGSVITDKTQRETVKENTIRMIAREIKAAKEKKKNLRIILGHGGGSFPHYPAKKYRVKEGIISSDSWRGFAETRAAASKLNQIVTDIFLEEGVNVVSFQPSSSVICNNGKIVHMDVRQLKYLIDNNQIPVTYGDAVLDDHKGCTIISTEDIMVYLARLFFPKKIILAGEVEGVYTSDPLKNKNSRIIKEISNENIEEVKKMIGGSHGTDVTGGMFSKIMEMYNLVKINPQLKVQIISGDIEDRLKKAILNEPVKGTIVTYKGASPIPKYLFLDVNGVIVKQGIKPWCELLKELVRRKIISKEAWDGNLFPFLEMYLNREMDRDEAIRLLTTNYADALKGKAYKDIQKVAMIVLKKIRKYYNPYILKLIKLAKEKHWKIILMSGNFKEMGELIGKDVNADQVFGAGLEVWNDIITGNVEGKFMTASGKAEALQEILKKGDTLKEKTIYIGDDYGDWKAMQECGFNIIYQPDLSKSDKLTLEEREWIDEIMEIMRTKSIPNLIIATGSMESIRLDSLLDKIF